MRQHYKQDDKAERRVKEKEKKERKIEREMGAEEREHYRHASAIHRGNNVNNLNFKLTNSLEAPHWLHPQSTTINCFFGGKAKFEFDWRRRWAAAESDGSQLWHPISFNLWSNRFI